MICLIALVVFGILGIFSATYRKIAKEAFDCVFRRLTIRKCTSGLDKRLKSQLIGKLMKRNPKVARFTYKNFELISWFFTIILIISLIYTGLGIYNFAMYGNCNGANSQKACIYKGLVNSFENHELRVNAGCGNSLCPEGNCTCDNMSDCQNKEGDFCNKSCGGAK